MGINFPSSPALNDLYPTPAVAGVPQYRWDGTAWVTAVSQNEYVKKTGDTMSGPLVLGTPITGNDPRYMFTHSDNNTFANYSGPNFIAIDAYNNGVQTPILSFDYARGTLTASTAVQPNDALGTITWSAQTGPNPATDWNTPASMYVVVDAPVTGGVAPAAFNFISNGASNLFIGSDGQLVSRVDPAVPMALANKRYVDARALDQAAYSGIQFNGSMEVNQAGLTSVTANDTYLCDGWTFYGNGITGAVAAIDTSAPVPGFAYRIYARTNTAKPSLASGDYLMLAQKIEGYRIAKLGWGFTNAQPITIAFWSEHVLPGTYSIVVRNFGFTRCYAATYTQNVAGTREYKTVTIPGCTDGSWQNTTSMGMEVIFAAAVGSGGIAPSANTWVSGNYLAAPGQVNAANAATQNMVLRGVAVFPGIQAPTAAQQPLIMRPYDQELAVCQRYYHRIGQIAPWMWAPATPNVVILPVSISPTMRVAPTCTIPDISYGSNSTGAGFNAISSTSVCLQWSGVVAGNSLISCTIVCEARVS